MSEDGVTVTSADGEAEDGALRALREDQAKLDEAWSKRKRVLKKLKSTLNCTGAISATSDCRQTKCWVIRFTF